MDASAVLTPTNNYPPLLITQPSSLTVTQGATASFSAIVTGSSPKFQWRFNNANIAGATSNTLTLSNVTAASAGLYALVVSNATATITSSVASLSVAVTQSFDTVFFESFDSGSSATNWNIFDGAAKWDLRLHRRLVVRLQRLLQQLQRNFHSARSPRHQ